MSAWAKPGVKCVCVSLMPNGHPTLRLEVRKVYVIRDTFVSPSGDTSICLEGLLNDGGWGPYWHSSQFRPLITRTQEDDVAIFRKLLVTEGADA